MTLGVAIVGYGYAGRVLHAPLVLQTGGSGLRLHAVLARSAELRARAAHDHPGIAVYADMDTLLADDRVHIVVIATPPNTHAELALAAMRRTAHATDCAGGGSAQWF